MHYKYIEGRFNMKSIMLASVLVLSLSACVTNQQGGAVLGGVGGGIIGNQVGGGSGKTIATIGGAILGTIAGSAVGGNMDRQQQSNQPPQVIVQQPQPVPVHPQYQSYPNNSCSKYISNEGAYSACQRGLADRNAQSQRQLEDEAYKAGQAR